jgi:recombination DNA repair RAD52 pathway protein
MVVDSVVSAMAVVSAVSELNADSEDLVPTVLMESLSLAKLAVDSETDSETDSDMDSVVASVDMETDSDLAVVELNRRLSLASADSVDSVTVLVLSADSVDSVAKAGTMATATASASATVVDSSCKHAP